MNFPRPFAGADAATRRLRLVLLAATMPGMLSCLPLWLTARAYPVAPLVADFPNLPLPLDKLLLTGGVCGSVSCGQSDRARRKRLPHDGRNA